MKLFIYSYGRRDEFRTHYMNLLFPIVFINQDRSVHYARKTPGQARGGGARTSLALFIQLSVDILSMEPLQEWTLNQKFIAWQGLPCAI